MSPSHLLAWLVLAASALGLGQTATSTSTGAATTHTVKVGPPTNPYQFDPSSVNASVGDTILFQFYPRNHSVVKADFQVPCVPAAEGYFYSGSFNSFNEHNGNLIGPVSFSG